jgi:3'-phosphoadenosine 5'-phosphosulfate sulfotransferase (PAPS reductase)/FAD synthetase
MLEHAPFKVSDHCCDVMKKEPIHRYQKETKRMPITGVMAYESSRREKQYLQQGCNAYESKTNPISMPIAFWLEKDIWEYIKKYNISYSKIYDMGESRTGCIFCMFGVHLEKEPNRFQRLRESHPKLWEYCINKLNIKQCLDYIGVNY